MKKRARVVIVAGLVLFCTNSALAFEKRFKRVGGLPMLSVGLYDIMLEYANHRMGAPSDTLNIGLRYHPAVCSWLGFGMDFSTGEMRTENLNSRSSELDYYVSSWRGNFSYKIVTAELLFDLTHHAPRVPLLMQLRVGGGLLLGNISEGQYFEIYDSNDDLVFDGPEQNDHQINEPTFDFGISLSFWRIEAMVGRKVILSDTPQFLSKYYVPQEIKDTGRYTSVEYIENSIRFDDSVFVRICVLI